jgi:hypothetical protein
VPNPKEVLNHVDQTIEAGLDKAVDAALAWNKTNLIDAALHTSKLSPCKTGDLGFSLTVADLMTDAANCGACGNACALNEVCNAGVCACPADATVCSGVCTLNQTDVNNCGACGNVCPAGKSCANGVCINTGRLSFTLVWDKDVDVDLAVTPPCRPGSCTAGDKQCAGSTVYYEDETPSDPCGGVLDKDSKGFGPENIYWPTAGE